MNYFDTRFDADPKETNGGVYSHLKALISVNYRSSFDKQPAHRLRYSYQEQPIEILE